jgi:transcriptional regulator with XRE-family HTH domain
MRGLTQQQLAELVGITYQQAHKYESGTNRVAVGRLYAIAQALGVDPSYFFEGLGLGAPTIGAQPQPAMLGLARSFTNLPSRRHQEAVCELARALASSGPGDSNGEPEANAPSHAA